MSTLFISHSSKDNEFAEKVKIRLAEKNHHSVFLDFDPEKGIKGGQSWEQTLYRKLRACHAVIVICTKNHISSKWCFAEIALARMEGKHVITLLCDSEVDFSDMPSILTERQIINLTEDEEEGYQRFWNALEEEKLMAIVGEWDSEKPPYLGLSSFSEADAPVFFGRDEEIRSGVELLSRGAPNMVMVMGASGSGKSSLVMAGIIPRVRRYPKEWIILDPFRPGTNPFAEFAVSMSKAFRRTVPVEKAKAYTPQRIESDLMAAVEQLHRGRSGQNEVPRDEVVVDERLHRLIEQIEAIKNDPPEKADIRFKEMIHWSLDDLKKFCGIHKNEGPVSKKEFSPTALNEMSTLLKQLSKDQRNAKVLIVVDQFEEFFGYHENGELHDQFLKLLRASLDADHHSLMVLGSMRSDFLGSFQRNKSLRGFDYETLSLGPMGIENMRKIIESPAKLGALELEIGLTDLLLEDTGTPDALPLLSFTLKKLWQDYGGDGKLEISEYNSLGGLHGAITKEANSILKIARQQNKVNSLRLAFIKMARLSGDGSYARQSVSTESEEINAVKDILDLFIERRLLFSYEKNNTQVIEVAHEALFRSWRPLKVWLDDNRSEYLFQQQLERDAETWSAKEEPTKDDLWKGGKLEQAKDFIQYADLGKVVNDFVETGLIESNKEKKRQRRVFIMVSSVIVLFAIASVFFFFQSKEALKDSKFEALLGEAFFISQKDPTTALHLAHHVLTESGGEHEKAKDLRNTIFQYYDENDFYTNIFEGHQGPLNCLAFSPDGEQILSSSSDSTIVLWSLDGAKLKDYYFEDGDVSHIEFSPDGRSFIALKKNGDASYLDLEGNILNTTNVFKNQSRFVNSFFLNLDISQVRAAITGNQVLDLSYSPDGNYLIARSSLDAFLWNPKIDTAAIVLKGEGAQYLRKLIFSQDGTSIYGIESTGNIFQWDLKGELISKIVQPGDYPSDGVFTEKENTIFSMVDSVTINQFLFPNNDKRDQFLINEVEGDVNDFYISKNKKRIITTSDGQVLLHNIENGEVKVLQDNLETFSVSFTPGENYIYCLTHQKVFLWNLDGNLVFDFYHSMHKLPHVEFSKDDRYILVEHQKTFLLRDLKIILPKIDRFSRGKYSVSLMSQCDLEKSADCEKRHMMLTSGNNNNAVLLDEEGKVNQEFVGHNKEVLFSTISPLGDKIGTGSSDSTAILWTLDGKVLARLKGHSGPVFHIAFSKDGQHVITASGNGEAIYWDLEGNILKKHEALEKSEVQKSEGPGFSFSLSSRIAADLENKLKEKTHVDISPDGNFALIGTPQKGVILWDLVKDEPKNINESDSMITYVRFLGDNNSFFYSTRNKSEDGEWKCYLRQIDGKLLKDFSFEGDGNFSMSKDGKYILNGTREIVDINGDMFQSLMSSKIAGSSLNFSHCGRYVIFRSSFGEISIKRTIDTYFEENQKLTDNVVKNVGALNFHELFSSEIDR